MNVGDLVKEQPVTRQTSTQLNRVGVVIEIRRTKSTVLDYKNQDSFLVLWPQGFEWSWKSEIKLVPEKNSIQ